MRRNIVISASLTAPSARIILKSSSITADKMGSSATLRTPGSPSNSEAIFVSSPFAICALGSTSRKVPRNAACASGASVLEG